MGNAKKQESRPRKARHYEVTDTAQLEALIAPLRLRLFGAAALLGPCSVAELAEHVGEKRESVYFHIHQLVLIGLLREVGTRSTSRRDELLYDTPASSIGLRFEASDPANVEAHINIASAGLRMTMRDLPAAFKAGPKTRGKRRELNVSRLRGWLDQDDLQRANELIGELQGLFQKSRRSPETRPFSFSSVLMPVPEKGGT